MLGDRRFPDRDGPDSSAIRRDSCTGAIHRARSEALEIEAQTIEAFEMEGFSQEDLRDAVPRSINMRALLRQM
jgi:hypothetical protein